MDRRLEIKKFIQEYFEKHRTTQKLTGLPSRRSQMRCVCSLLGPAAEGATLIQGVVYAILGQAAVLTAEVVKILRKDTQEVRMTGTCREGTPAVEHTAIRSWTI